MSILTRVSLGPLHSWQDPTPMLWALLASLRYRGHQVQVFHDQACFANEKFSSDHVSQTICGQCPRYLDSWLMSPSLCRETFAYGMNGADFGLVLGQYGTAASALSPRPASLEPLCDWLDLPRLVVIDAAEQDPCLIPICPPDTAGVLLDRVPRGKFIELQTVYEAHWGVPVLGGLPDVDELRPGKRHSMLKGRSSCNVCEALGRYLSATLRWDKLLTIAGREFDTPVPKIFSPGQKLSGLRVAVALDEAIHQYYPEVLDLLELQGATVEDFSILRDQSLPAGVDVVFLGGGPLESYASQISQNQCLTLAMQDHVRQGGRIYAEGAGAALLCQQLKFTTGEQFPMLGVLPAMASFDPAACDFSSEELEFTENHWLGETGNTLRGYRDQRWQLDFTENLNPLATGTNHPQMFSWQQVAASQVHLNFALQPGFLRRFASAGAAIL